MKPHGKVNFDAMAFIFLFIVIGGHLPKYVGYLIEI